MLFVVKNAPTTALPDIEVVLANTSLEYRKCVRNLGLFLDVDVRYREHGNHPTRKAFCDFKILYPNRHNYSTNGTILLCDSLVLLHFKFCDIIYKYYMVLTF